MDRKREDKETEKAASTGGADLSVTKSSRGVPQHGGRRVSGAGGGLADDLSVVAAFNAAVRRLGAAASRPESGAGCMLLHGRWHSTKS